MRILSLGFFIGILLVLWLPDQPLFTHPWLVVIFCSLIVLSLSFNLWFLRLASAIVLGFLTFIITSNEIVQSRFPETLHGKDLIIAGRVISIPVNKTKGRSFIFDIEKANTKDNPSQPLALKGKVRLSWYSLNPPIAADETWQFTVRLKPPSGFMNPGGFDYETWLFSNRIIATGYVKNKSPYQHIELARPYSVNHLRERIQQEIQSKLPDQEQTAIISALAVAERGSMTQQQWDVLRQTGTNHLMAISGLHIGIVAGLGFIPVWLIALLYPRIYLRINKYVLTGVIGALLATGYTLLAGFTIPTQRALIMVLVIVAGLVMRRSIDSLTLLSIALVCVLLYDPLAILAQGFWLSFLAVGIIFYWLRRRIQKGRFEIISIQLALSLGMMPITLLFFGEAPLIAPIANLIAIPWVSIILVPTILLAIILLWLAPTLSQYLLEFASWNIARLFDLLSWLAGLAPHISFPLVPRYYLLVALIGFFILILPKHFPARWLGMILFVPALLYAPEKPDFGEFDLHILDVGQGSANVIQTQNHTFVFDAGPKSGETFDTGKLVVLPFLRAKNIQKIDTLMISHEDNDHSGGLQAIVEAIPTDKVVSSDTTLLPGNIIQPCEKGNEWTWDGVTFSVLHPTKDWQSNDNDRSCVIKVSNADTSVLITGDAQKRAERFLLKHQREALKADILILGHHGSKTSSTPAFLEAVKPKTALVSAGYMNRFRFPSKKVMARLSKLGITTYNTANKGGISARITNKDDTIKWQFYRDKIGKFWHR